MSDEKILCLVKQRNELRRQRSPKLARELARREDTSRNSCFVSKFESTQISEELRDGMLKRSCGCGRQLELRDMIKG